MVHLLHQMDQTSQQQLSHGTMSHQINTAAHEKYSRSAAAANGTAASYMTSEFLSDDDNTEKMGNNVNYNQSMIEDVIRTTAVNVHTFDESFHHSDHQLQVKARIYLKNYATLLS